MPTNYTLLSPLASSGKMEVTPQQSEILQRHLLNGGNPITGIHTLLAWNEKSIWGYTYRKDFEKCEEPLHHFNNHFKIEE